MPSFRFSNQPLVNYNFTCAGINQQRAKRAFEAVASVMSPIEKAAIRNYWIQHPDAPVFSIVDTFILDGVQNGVPFQALGENVTGEGLEFRFAGRAMHRMCTILVETLVAHEIAHAVIYREIRDGELLDEEDVLYRRIGADHAALIAWSESAVNRRILSWNPRYDDEKVRDWLEYYRARGTSPPSPGKNLIWTATIFGAAVVLLVLLWLVGII